MNNNKNSDKFKTETAAIKSFADCIDDSVIILDDKDAIIYLNQSARSLFMVSGNNFIEKPVEVLLPDYKDYFEKDYLDSDFNTDIILKINKHKKEFNIAINNIVNSKLKNSQGKIIVLRDITKNRLINEKLNYRIKFEKLITKISTNFIKLSLYEIDREIRNTLKKIGEFTGVDRIYIYRLHKKVREADKTYEWHKKGIEPKADKLKGIPSKNKLKWYKKLESFEPVYISSISKAATPRLKVEKEILGPQGVKTILLVPMIYGKVLKGFLGLESIKKKRRWTVNDMTLLKLLGEIVVNVLERKKTDQEIRDLSLKDKLTGLYNRTYFEEEIKRLDTKRQLPLSFIMGDINGLKLVNDAFGPKEGDRLLKKIAEILKKCCRKEDIVSRWGGDEFSILLPKTSDKDAEEILNRIRIACFKTRRHKVPINISFGASTKKNTRQDMESVVREAEDWMYRRKLLERQSISSSIISSLEKTLQEKSQETEEHAFRMKELALKLGNTLGLKENKLNELSLLAALHDIGKVVISNEILMKKGELTEKEWEMMKRHPEVGYNICSSSPQLQPIAEGILSHHEWWDGSGYPRGLKGEEIPLTSRIISIVDAYDVMTHDRCYKKAVSKEEAVNELKRCSGTQFDPSLVEIFINIVKNI
jgi:diguanylate cyclase (GGDEF)-like protein